MNRKLIKQKQTINKTSLQETNKNKANKTKKYSKINRNQNNNRDILKPNRT